MLHTSSTLILIGSLFGHHGPEKQEIKEINTRANILFNQMFYAPDQTSYLKEHNIEWHALNLRMSELRVKFSRRKSKTLNSRAAKKMIKEMGSLHEAWQLLSEELSTKHATQVGTSPAASQSICPEQAWPKSYQSDRAQNKRSPKCGRVLWD